MIVSTRVAGVVTLVAIAIACGCHVLDPEHPAAAAAKLLSATVAIAVLPGAVVTLLWRPRPQMTILEVIGFGLALSAALVELCTILAVVLHVSSGIVGAMLLAGTVMAAARLVQQPTAAVVVEFDEAIVLLLLAVLAVVLYGLGSPLATSEDDIHVAIVRRLAALGSPRFDNLYFVPGVIYTYPFPGIHYMLSLIARVGDVDALFVYQKLRFFWGPAALVMLYLAARAVFARASIAVAVSVTAVVLVANGTFALVPGFRTGWGQLVPFSHASDIAQAVLLPALMVVGFGFLLAQAARERAFFLLATALLSLMLTIVHIREIVQFAAYSGCFFLVTLLVPRFRPYMRRAAAMLALVVGMAVAYGVWQAASVPLVSDIVAQRRAHLMSTAAQTPLRDLLLEPATGVVGEFMPEFVHLWHGLTPFFLFTGAAVVVVFRTQPLIWFAAASLIAYLAVMSVPILAISYIYATYHEILYTAVRNVAFFVYLFAGAFLYVTVLVLVRAGRTRLTPVAAGALAGVAALLASLCLNQSGRGFFMPLIAAYAMTFLALGEATSDRGMRLRRVGIAAVSLVALAALWPERPPAPRTEQVAIRWRPGLADAQRAALQQQFSLADGEPRPERSGEADVWDYRVADLSTANINAIVRHPDVLDTHFIDRSTFVVESQPPPGEHLPLTVRYVRWMQYPAMPVFVGTIVVVWALAFVVPGLLASIRGRQALTSLDAVMREPFYRYAAPFALFVVPFAIASARPTLSPMTIGAEPARAATTPAGTLSQISCVTTPRLAVPVGDERLTDDPVIVPERTTCPPDPALVAWVNAHVPPEAVFAIDMLNPFLPALFMPQQIVAYPIAAGPVLVRQNELFEPYYRFFDDRMRQHREQPFFNTVETLAERMAFISALGVTHVLVDPAYYDALCPVLDALPAQFALQVPPGPSGRSTR